MDNHDFTQTHDPAELQQLQRRLQAVLQASGIRPRLIFAINLARGEWIDVSRYLLAFRAETGQGDAEL